MEEKKFKRTLVTTALPYANGPVHIGHLAGVYVPADIYTRYLRLKGEDVIMIGGSDEHGVPITIIVSRKIAASGITNRLPRYPSQVNISSLLEVIAMAVSNTCGLSIKCFCISRV